MRDTCKRRGNTCACAKISGSLVRVIDRIQDKRAYASLIFALFSNRLHIRRRSCEFSTLGSPGAKKREVQMNQDQRRRIFSRRSKHPAGISETFLRHGRNPDGGIEMVFSLILLSCFSSTRIYLEKSMNELSAMFQHYGKLRCNKLNRATASTLVTKNLHVYLRNNGRLVCYSLT